MENIVNQDEKVIINRPNKKVIFWDTVRRIFYLLIGIGITVYLCHSCLHCQDCNIVVTIHLCIISLTCFLSFGIPIDKLVSGINFSQ